MANNKNKMVVEITATDDTGKATKSAEKNLGGLTNAALGATAALAAAAVATVATLNKAVELYGRQEQAILQLEQRIKSTGGAAGKTSEELQGLAAGLQKITVFGDEAIIEMQSLLLTFTQIQGTNFDRAEKSILNVATALGTDLKSAALQVGKALNDPVGQMSALTRSGIQFSDEQKELIKTLAKSGDMFGAQAVILEELETQFGGAAEAARKGTGQFKATENAVGDLLEIIGGKLSPVLVTLSGDVEQVAIRFAEWLNGDDTAEDINLLTQSIEALRGELQRTESAIISDGFFAGLFFGDEGDATKIKAELDEMEAELRTILEFQRIAQGGEIEGPQLPAGGRPEAAAAPQDLSAETAANEAMEKLRSRFMLEQEFKTQQNEDMAILEAEGISRQETLRQEEEDRARQSIIDNDNWRTTQREMMVAANIDAAHREAEEKARTQKMLHDELGKGLSNLSGLMNSESRKAFEVGKAASIAQTTINTYDSATSSYKALSGIPVVGPYLGAAAAAAAVVAGLANVQAISATSFGGGGGGGGSSYSGIATNQTPAVNGDTSQFQPQPQPAVAAEALPPIVVENPGGLLGKWIEEQLAPALLEAQSRGVQTVIT